MTAPLTLTITLSVDPDALAALCEDDGCVLAELIRTALADAEMGARHAESDGDERSCP